MTKKWSPFTPEEAHVAFGAAGAKAELTWANTWERMSKLCDNWRTGLIKRGFDATINFVVDEEKLKMEDKQTSEIAVLKAAIAVYIAENMKLESDVDSLAATVERQTKALEQMRTLPWGPSDVYTEELKTCIAKLKIDGAIADGVAVDKIRSLESQLKSANHEADVAGRAINHKNIQIGKLEMELHELRGRRSMPATCRQKHDVHLEPARMCDTISTLREDLSDRFAEIVELKRESQEWRDQCYKRMDEAKRRESECVMIHNPVFDKKRNENLKCDQCGSLISLHTCPEAVSQILNAHLAENTWRPIEAAPKDGVRILARIFSPNKGWQSAIVSWRGGAWVEQEGWLYYSEVTHWIPLPKPHMPL